MNNPGKIKMKYPFPQVKSSHVHSSLNVLANASRMSVTVGVGNFNEGENQELYQIKFVLCLIFSVIVAVIALLSDRNDLF